MELTIGPEKYYAVYYGEIGTKGISEYLFKYDSEDPADYAQRLLHTSYNNWAARWTAIYIAYIMGNAQRFDREGGPPPLAISKRAIEHSLIGGVSWMLSNADGIRVYSCLQVKQAEGEDAVPGARAWLIEKKDERLKIVFPMSYDCEAPVGDIPGKIYNEYKKDGAWVVGKETKILSDQWVMLDWSGQGRSLLANVYTQCLKIFRYESLLDMAAMRLNFTYVSGTEVVGEDGSATQPLFNRPVAVPENGIPFSVVSASMPEVIRASREVLQGYIMDGARSLGLQAETAEEIGAPLSGQSKAWSTLDIQAEVKLAAYQATRAVSLALGANSRLNGVPKDQWARVSFSGDILVNATETDLANIRDAANEINLPAARMMAKQFTARAAFGNWASQQQMLELQKQIEADAGKTMPYDPMIGQGDPTSMVEGTGDDMEDIDSIPVERVPLAIQNLSLAATRASEAGNTALAAKLNKRAEALLERVG